MIHNLILALHISAGMLSIVVGPTYYIAARKGILTKPSLTRLRLATVISATLTSVLGITLIAMGFSITRICVTLSLYVPLMTTVVLVGDRQARRLYSN